MSNEIKTWKNGQFCYPGNNTKGFTYTDVGVYFDEFVKFNLKKIGSLNMSILEDKFCAERMPTWLVYCYTVIFIIGIIGNLTTCIVIIKNPRMRDATNSYLFSLAISDIFLLLIGMTIDYNSVWIPSIINSPLGITHCRLQIVFRVFYNASIITVTLFSLERYAAICYPFSFNAMSGVRRPIIIITGSWIVSIIMAIPQFFVRELLQVDLVIRDTETIIRSDTLFFCFVVYENSKVWIYVEVIIFFIAPTIIIAYAYLRMGITIYKSTRNHLSTDSEHSNSVQEMQARISVIKMLIVVVIITFISWSPRRIPELLILAKGPYKSHTYINTDFGWHYPNSLFYCSAAANPLIYNLMSTRYRQAFKELLWCKNNAQEISKAHETTYATSKIHEILSCKKNLDETRKNGGNSAVLETNV